MSNMSKRRSAPSRGETKRSLKSNTSLTTVSLQKVESKDTIIRNLLISLFPTITSKHEIHNCFAKLTFNNSNLFCGWINLNGFNGYGTYTFANGSSYRGSFRDSLTHGLGRYTYVNGSVYEGEFLAGCRHGYGQYRTKRFRYDGYFYNGKFHGQGVWKSKSEEERGLFEDGRLTQGEVRDGSGLFMGKFDKSGLRKHGTFFFKNGNVYNGGWSNDLFYGFGVYDWVGTSHQHTNARTKYIGYWLEGKRHALGMLTFQQRSIICQWTRDRKYGAGLVIACNGYCYASPEMFNNNQYVGSHRINMCKESRTILHDILKLTTPTDSYCTMEELSTNFLSKIKELVQNYSAQFSEVYPVRIPHHELCTIPSRLYNSCNELKSLQQLLSEQYKGFFSLYNKYIQPGDDYMNDLGLNLFYMDVFHGVRDVNVSKALNTAMLDIRHHHIYLQDSSANDFLNPVPFYEFFQHFIRITLILMASVELKFRAEQERPTFFGHLAMQVLLCYQMLLVQKQPDFLVREALSINRPAVLSLLQSIKQQALGDRSIRATYKFLHNCGIEEGKSLSFIEASQIYFPNMYCDGFLRDSEFEVCDLELVEVVMRTCQIQIAKEVQRQYKKLQKAKLRKEAKAQ